jgi:hypothetical protein
MHILIGLVLALVLLYHWLLGHWFARVVAFFPIAAVVGFVGWMVGMGLQPEPTAEQLRDARYHVAGGYSDDAAVSHYARAHQSEGIPTLGAMGGIAAAWFISGVPIYWRRRQTPEVPRW